jgi:hypothetical protein
MFENTALRSISGPKREEIKEGQRKLHNEELRNLYSSTNTRTINAVTLSWAHRFVLKGEN